MMELGKLELRSQSTGKNRAAGEWGDRKNGVTLGDMDKETQVRLPSFQTGTVTSLICSQFVVTSDEAAPLLALFGKFQ